LGETGGEKGPLWCSLRFFVFFARGGIFGDPGQRFLRPRRPFRGPTRGGARPSHQGLGGRDPNGPARGDSLFGGPPGSPPARFFPNGPPPGRGGPVFFFFVASPLGAPPHFFFSGDPTEPAIFFFPRKTEGKGILDLPAFAGTFSDQRRGAVRRPFRVWGVAGPSEGNPGGPCRFHGPPEGRGPGRKAGAVACLRPGAGFAGPTFCWGGTGRLGARPQGGFLPRSGGLLPGQGPETEGGGGGGSKLPSAAAFFSPPGKRPKGAGGPLGRSIFFAERGGPGFPIPRAQARARLNPPRSGGHSVQRVPVPFRINRFFFSGQGNSIPFFKFFRPPPDSSPRAEFFFRGAPGGRRGGGAPRSGCPPRPSPPAVSFLGRTQTVQSGGELEGDSSPGGGRW